MSNLIGLDCNLGLANRTRVLDCMLDLAHTHDRKLILYWPKDCYLCCDFNDLFELPERVTRVVSFNLLHSRAARIMRRIQEQAVHLTYSHVYRQQDVEKMAAERNIDPILRAAKPYLDTVTRLYLPEQPYRYLSPAAALRRKIDEFTLGFDQNVIGVHVRRGDNYRSASQSGLDLFVRRMHEEIAKNGACHFFLATDDQEVERCLVKSFPGRIIIRQKKSIDRSDPVGVQDALIDLYCLSRSSKIFGSFHSSFSEEAALIGRIPLEIVQ